MDYIYLSTEYVTRRVRTNPWAPWLAERLVVIDHELGTDYAWRNEGLVSDLKLLVTPWN